jgi:threonine/homoserine/homoserine lactone efflux protein
VSPETAAALASFAFVTSFTPGPNNIMLTASGVNFGFARTIPHMFGVSLGFLVLLVACGAGLGALFASYPQARTVLKFAGALYLVWFAWKVANAANPERGESAGAPLTFLQAAAFQWLNPKGVIVALGTIAIYVRPETALRDLALVLAIFAVATAGAVVTWSVFGVALSRALDNPRRARVFNIAMALLLVASVVPMLLI